MKPLMKKVTLGMALPWWLTVFLVAAAILMGSVPRASAAGPALVWENPFPEAKEANLNAVTYANGLYVAVGESGTIRTSVDGKAWTRVESGTNLPLKSIAYGNGRFVAVGGKFDLDYNTSDNVIVTSADGRTWSAQRAPGMQPSQPLGAVAFGADRFIAFEGGVVITSIDGVTWSEPRATGIDGSPGHIAYGNGRFVATAFLHLYYSENGLDWTKSAKIENGRSVMFGGGQFLAVRYGYGAEVLASPDGVTWSPARPAGPADGQQFNAVAYGNGHYVGVGYRNVEGIIMRTDDAVTWQEVTSGTKSELQAIVYGDGQFVAVGRDGTTLTLDQTGNWEARPVRRPGDLTSVAYGGTTFVAVGDAGAVLTSTDGREWTQRNVHIREKLNRVRYGAGKFVAVGEKGTIVASADGLTWSTAYEAPDPGLRGLVYAGGRFVAVGYPGVILTSDDGLHWDTRWSSATKVVLSDVAYGKGRYMVVGDKGLVLTSADGVAWTESASGVYASLTHVHYLGGRFFVDGGTYATPDAEHFNLVHTPWMWNITDTVRGDGWQVTVGNAAFSSRDGIDWMQEPDEEKYLSGIAYGGGRFVALGWNDRIRTAVSPMGASAALPLPERVKINQPTIAAPAPFSDLVAEHWAYRPMNVAANARLILGYQDGTFVPAKRVQRAEFLAMVMRAYPQPDSKGEDFGDVPADHWAHDLILQARGAGLVRGDTNNDFHPNAFITRAELAVILQRAVNLALPAQPVDFPDMTTGWDWAAPSVQALTAYGVVRGLPDGTYGPSRPATRAEASAILVRLFD